jgi:2-keto-4-pentenoate hydratase/2-oxohepta-3-ene-1,7-dioic acid hydratase in catechol pathway
MKRKDTMNNTFNPTKIICAGLNYRSHANEMGMKIPDSPIIFLKPLTSLIYNDDAIILPEMSDRVDYEAELAVVIGRKCKSVSPEEAYEVIEGYTCLNDVTARDLQSLDGQWTRAKGFDTFCPVGPRIIKNVNPDDLHIQCRVNGVIVQDSGTFDFIFKVGPLVSFISRVMTLEKGDIISTGTPSGIGRLNDGDTVEVEIEKIGILKNHVKKSVLK